MNNILIKCPHCNTIFKIVKSADCGIFITDFGDVFTPEENYNYKCLNCKEEFNILNNHKITEDWVANLFFKIKGN